MGPYLLVAACAEVLDKNSLSSWLTRLCHPVCSRAPNEEAQLRNQKGSDIFAEPDALQTREVNQRKLQVATCCSLFLPLHVDVFGPSTHLAL